MEYPDLLPEEDTLLYIQELEDHALPLPDNDYSFLSSSPTANTQFLRTYGLIATRLATRWHKKHRDARYSLSEIVAISNAALLAAREAFIADPANRQHRFTAYAEQFVAAEMDRHLRQAD